MGKPYQRWPVIYIMKLHIISSCHISINIQRRTSRTQHSSFPMPLHCSIEQTYISATDEE